MAISDALYDYGAGSENTGPPTPTGLEENKSKWREFLAKLGDPNIRQAMISTGIGMMRSPGYGQNSGDVLAGALESGVTTLRGLRAMDYERAQREQARTDRLKQQGIENTRGDRQVAVSERGAAVGERQATTQERVASSNIDNSAMELNLRDAQLQETQRHNLATEEIGRRQADADAVRAKAYSSVGNRTPQDIQKVNALSQYYMQNEGLDEVSARAKAVMYVESTGAAKSPGEQAQKLYEAKIKAWQGDLNNFGKSLTREQLMLMQQDSINEVVAFQQFNNQSMGAPTTTDSNNPRKGKIDRSGGSPVGTVKNGYKKIAAGQDTDKATWQKVNTNGNTQ